MIDLVTDTFVILPFEAQENMDPIGDTTEEECKPTTPLKLSKSWSGLKIIQFRSRRASTPEAAAAQVHGNAASIYRNGDAKEYKIEILNAFSRAVEERDTLGILQAITQQPKLVQLQTMDDALLLHQVCKWPELINSLEIFEFCVKEHPEGVAFMDHLGRTPLHYLCMNPSVTVRTIELLVVAFPVSAAMCDKESNLPVHYLCLNPSQTIDMTMMLHNYETFSLRNRDGQTPLHCLLLKKECNFELCATVLSLAPETTSVTDRIGRTILHWICANSDHLDEQMLQLILSLDNSSVKHSDMNGQLPLHLLLANVHVTLSTMRQLLQVYPSAVDVVDMHGQSPLHMLCINEAITLPLLIEYASICTTFPTSLLWTDNTLSTTLHVICMNPKATTDIIRAVFELNSKAVTSIDHYGCTPFHYICSNQCIAVEIIWLFLDHAHGITKIIDHRGKTPLHYLAANTFANTEMITIVFDSDPNASQVTDHAMKLPVHYVIENPSIPSAHAYKLLAGGAAYRLRYLLQDHAVTDFKSTTFHHSIDLSGSSEVLYSTEDYGVDSTATDSMAPESTPPLIDSFANARRRIRLTEAKDSNSMTLEYCIVTQKPVATLSEHINTIDIVLLAQSLGTCVNLWHKMQLVHGNISPETVFVSGNGYFVMPEPSNLMLHGGEYFEFPLQNTFLSSPEMARAYLRGETPRPTQASDMWQLGCTLFQVAIGCSFVEKIAPFAAMCTKEQVYHAISTVNSTIVQHIITEAPPEIQRILKHLLDVSPTHRWTSSALVDAIMNPKRPVPPFLTVISENVDDNASTTLIASLREEVVALRTLLQETKTQLRRTELERDNVLLQLSELVDRLNAILLEKEESKHQVAVMEKKRISLTEQLDTMVHMLISVMPLAQKVYGTMGEDLLARLMSHAALGTPPNSQLYAIPDVVKTPIHRMLRERIRNTMLSRGCVAQWANNIPPIILEKDDP
ncbi:hypothetical protein THRCLA_00010 [Thraustotheca clavata]|uniref:Protein kinase domain-containing protein n=1 Tax=Thraustotheca clavata TaxID=74557 RepID=A0A1W0ACU3_9STRA|nr:hypothetical protein THRCLA_00010 [Thraustotheca clavata]